MPKNSRGYAFWSAATVALAVVAIAPLLFYGLLYGSVICRSLGIGSLAAIDRATREADAGNVCEAMKWCDEAIRRDPKSIPSHELRGMLRERQGDFLNAVKDYSTLIELQPGLPDYHIDRGRAYEGLGELDNAVSDYCDAICSDWSSRGSDTLYDWAEQRAGCSSPNVLEELVDLFEDAIARHPQDERLQRCLRELRSVKESKTGS